MVLIMNLLETVYAILSLKEKETKYNNKYLNRTIKYTIDDV